MRRLFVVAMLLGPGVASARPASKGAYAEAGGGATLMLGDGASWAAPGPALSLRVGYDLFGWLSLGVAADVASDGFVRRLAGQPLGHALAPAALARLRDAIAGEVDYRAEADALERAAQAWAGDPTIAIPAVVRERSSKRVLTMVRAPGVPLADLPAGDAALHAEVALAIVRFAWGTPLNHGFLNADPNPGNYLIGRGAEPRVWFLDFGCTVELEPEVVAADRAIWHGILDDDSFSGAERFRMALASAGLLRQASSLTSTVHREWEAELAAPWSTHEPFRWDRHYASRLTTATRDVLAAGGLGLPPSQVLLWRQRMGVAAVLGMLEPRAHFRRALLATLGTGRRALR